MKFKYIHSKTYKLVSSQFNLVQLEKFLKNSKGKITKFPERARGKKKKNPPFTSRSDIRWLAKPNHLFYGQIPSGKDPQRRNLKRLKTPGRNCTITRN